MAELDIDFLVYLLIGIPLVVLVGSYLYLQGAPFLVMVYRDKQLARAVNRLMAVGFQLMGLGFVLLTSAIGAGATGAVAARVLVLKLGLLCLVLGFAHLIAMSGLTGSARSREYERARREQWAYRPPSGPPEGATPAASAARQP